MSTERQPTSQPAPAPDADAHVRHPNLRAVQILDEIAARDPEQQRLEWLEFRRAIDEDRAEDEKHYPWPVE